MLCSVLTGKSEYNKLKQQISTSAMILFTFNTIIANPFLFTDRSVNNRFFFKVCPWGQDLYYQVHTKENTCYKLKKKSRI